MLFEVPVVPGAAGDAELSMDWDDLLSVSAVSETDAERSAAARLPSALWDCPPGWAPRGPPIFEPGTFNALTAMDRQRLESRQQRAADRHHVQQQASHGAPQSPARRRPRSMLEYLSYVINPDSNGKVLSPRSRQRAIGRLPTFRADARCEPCSICLDVARGDLLTPLPCAHIFHNNCIKQWLVMNDECPLCKQPSLGTT